MATIDTTRTASASVHLTSATYQSESAQSEWIALVAGDDWDSPRPISDRDLVETALHQTRPIASDRFDD